MPCPNCEVQLRALSVQTDAALAIDGLKTVITALNYLLNNVHTRKIFKTFRHGELYNNDTRGIQCWTQPVMPWVHGSVIKDALSEVSCSFFEQVSKLVFYAHSTGTFRTRTPVVHGNVIKDALSEVSLLGGFSNKDTRGGLVPDPACHASGAC